MKKLIILYFILSLVSCNYLDVVPDNVATIDNAFTDKYNTEKYLFTCYSYLPKMGSINENPALLGSGEVSMNSTHINSMGLKLANGYQSVSDPVFNYWEGKNGGSPLYTGIRDCNTFISRVDGVLALTDSEKRKMKAEAKFIKAYLHFYLLRMYGPIHVIKENKSVSESIESLKLERNSTDEAFSYIVELLDDAIKDLPLINENEDTELGRITSVIAAAVKAKVLVTAASPLFNGESGIQIQNKDGKSLFPDNTNNIAQKWQDAVDACQDAISLAHNSGYRLTQMSDFAEKGTVSDTTKMKVTLGYRVWNRENNTEVIWPHTNSLVTSLQGDAMPQYFSAPGTAQANGYYGVPLKSTMLYYTSNGVPIEEDKDWQNTDINELLTVDNGHKYFLRPGRTTVKRNLNREFRYYSDLSFDGTLIYGHQRVFSNDEFQNLDYINHLASGHSAAGHSSRINPFGYWPLKLVHIESGYVGNLWRTTAYAFPALRLADLYLLNAEALIETNNLELAKEWINKVRERAGLLSIDEAWSQHSIDAGKPSTQSGLREILHRERLIELAFEGSYYWDIRRWLEAEKYVNTPLQGWRYFEQTFESYYQPKTVYRNSFQPNEYFFPISEQEIAKNPNLVQNYAW